MLYGIVLLPDTQLSEQIIEYSCTFVDDGNAVMHLSPIDKLPHLTLLHVSGKSDQVNEWWKQASTSLPSQLEVKLNGIKFSPAKPDTLEDGGFFGLEANSTSWLRDAHYKLIELANQLKLKPTSAKEENFSPHVTLGVLRNFPKKALLPSELLTATFKGTLALAELGPFGTVKSVLYKAE